MTSLQMSRENTLDTAEQEKPMLNISEQQASVHMTTLPHTKGGHDDSAETWCVDVMTTWTIYIHINWWCYSFYTRTDDVILNWKKALKSIKQVVGFMGSTMNTRPPGVGHDYKISSSVEKTYTT